MIITLKRHQKTYWRPTSICKSPRYKMKEVEKKTRKNKQNIYMLLSNTVVYQIKHRQQALNIPCDTLDTIPNRVLREVAT